MIDYPVANWLGKSVAVVQLVSVFVRRFGKGKKGYVLIFFGFSLCPS